MITTAPLVGWVTEAMLMGPPSGSVSFDSTSMVVAEASLATVAVSSTATGGSSRTGLMATVMVRHSSVEIMVNAAAPVAPADAWVISATPKIVGPLSSSA